MRSYVLTHNHTVLDHSGEGANQGTKIGSLKATGTITFTGQYAYIGIRPDGTREAVYISSIDIVWE